MPTNNTNSNFSSSIGGSGSGGLLRCFCNDDYLCLNKDYCDSETVCMTKRVKLTNNTTKLKYYCGENGNTFRNLVIGYRDCDINTRNQNDYNNVLKNSEWCCKTEALCNKKLNPIVASEEIIFYDPNTHKTNINTNIKQNESTSFRPNINEPATSTGLLTILLTPVVTLVIVLIVLVFVYYVYKRIKDKRKKLPKSNPLLATEHQQTPNISTSLSSGSNSNIGGGSRSKRCLSLNTLINMFKRRRSNQYKTDQQILQQHQQLQQQQQQKPIYRPSDAPYIIGESLFVKHYHQSAQNLNANMAASLRDCYPSSSTNENGQLVSSTTITNTCDMLGGTTFFTGSGSGAGNPICVQRTISKDIDLIKLIGQGRYGSVWKGKWLGGYVAVKTFNSAEEKQWENEVSIYLTQSLRHDNILGFIATDNTDLGTYTELWIITDYHVKGSLFDYLLNRKLTPQQTLKMAVTIIRGLLHLHLAIKGCRGSKLEIAHCDLKSKNILVKSDLTCCIGDFGLAVCGDSDGNIPQSRGIISGTKRYMAPEILSRSINPCKIESYKKADMYSLGLVYWEMLRRCEFKDPELNEYVSLDYQPPYHEYVSANPTEAEICDVVYKKKKRPQIIDEWRKNECKIVSELASLIEELWCEDPDARLQTLRVKYSLESIENVFGSTTSLFESNSETV